MYNISEDKYLRNNDWATIYALEGGLKNRMFEREEMSIRTLRKRISERTLGFNPKGCLLHFPETKELYKPEKAMNVLKYQRYNRRVSVLLVKRRRWWIASVTDLNLEIFDSL